MSGLIEGGEINAWQPLDDGATLGIEGSEDGEIIRDEEHPLGARITLEERCRGGIPFAITCGLYGWMCHTRYFGDLQVVSKKYEAMKSELARILASTPSSPVPDEETQTDHLVGEITRFVDQFP